MIQADLHFPSGDRAYAQLTYGGEHLAETGNRLTAVLLTLTGRKRDYDPESVGGWFRGEPRSVVALEKGPAEVLLVRSPGTATAINRLAGLPTTSAGRIPMAGIAVPATTVGDRVRTSLSLSRGTRMRVLEPYAKRVERGHLSFETFIVSPDLAHDGGVPWALMQSFALSQVHKQPRVVDAVAIAGLQAAIGNRRRAVVLIDTGDRRDFSTLEAEAAFNYLRRLGVPFYVWRLAPETGPSAWPRPKLIHDYGDLRRAVRDLREELARQRVIWLEGDWDVEAVRLTEGAPARVSGAAG